MLKLQQVRDWLESPVTEEFHKLLLEHLAAHKEALNNKVLYTNSFDSIKEELIQLRGQILTIELISDLSSFTEELLEDAQIQTHSTELYSKDY
jgi:hypothetical protein